MLLRKQGAMPTDDFRKRRLLHPEPMVSAVISRPRPDALKIEPMDLANNAQPMVHRSGAAVFRRPSGTTGPQTR